MIYLPSGPVLDNGEGDEEGLVSHLHTASSANIARINYRASSMHQYPTPYHDVLFGYDWILENLLKDEFDRNMLARLGVCGQLVGGSLATMLALTECRVGESRIGAAAINNPIMDWVFPEILPFVNPADLPEPIRPEETALPADEDLGDSLGTRTVPKAVRKLLKKKPKSMPLTPWQEYRDDAILSLQSLSAARSALFRRPEDYFDRFTSPIHFFRSPHAQLLLPEADDVSASHQSGQIQDMETQMALDHYATFHNTPKLAPELPILARCRAYARNYPPAGTKLSLPVWRITTGSKSMLSDQALELVKVLRRSIARQSLKSHTGRSRWHDSSEKASYEELAAERVHLSTIDSTGLWSHSTHNPDAISSIQESGLWIKEQLEPGNT